MLGPPGQRDSSLMLLVMGAVFIVLGAWLGRYLPDVWRGGPAYRRMKQLFDFYGESMSNSIVSALPIDSPFLIALGVLALLIVIRDAANGVLLSAVQSVSYVVVPIFIALLALFFTVILFGWPKPIIPPHLRHHRGLAPEFFLSAFRWISSRKPHRGAARRK